MYVRRRTDEGAGGNEKTAVPEAASQETCSFAAAGQASEKSSSEENRSVRGSVIRRSPFLTVRILLF